MPDGGQRRARQLQVSERARLPETEIGLADRLIDAARDVLLWAGPLGWLAWDGRCFRADPDIAHAVNFAKKNLPGLIYDEAAWLGTLSPVSTDQEEAYKGAPAKSDNQGGTPAEKIRRERRQARLKWQDGISTDRAIKAALSLARAELEVDVSALDGDLWGLPVANGRVDLLAAAGWERPEGCTDEEELAARWSWLGDPRPDLRPTRCAKVAYDPAAECPAWLAFIALLFPDPAHRAYVQRCLGYLLSGENGLAAIFLAEGGGGNGKSVLFAVLRFILGKLVEDVKVEAFLETRPRDANDASPAEVEMRGTRAILASEPSARAVLDMPYLKALTGGEERASRQLHGREFHWTPRMVPILLLNTRPKLKDADRGVARRLHILPFTVDLTALPPEQRREREEVLAELRAEAPGILNWLIDGWRDYRARGDLGTPADIEAARDEYVASADPVGRFLAEMCVRDPSGRIPRPELWEAYQTWWEETGATAQLWSKFEVFRRMREKGYGEKPVKGTRYFAGLRWAADTSTATDTGPPF